MRPLRMLLPLILLLIVACPTYAQEEGRPETVLGRMSVKLVRGIANVATCVVELPKQTYLTVRDQGAAGYLVGPLKGVGMTVLRALGGAAETVFFLVPQPGYYDPVMDPAYVWQGWEPRQAAGPPPAETGETKGVKETVPGKKE